MEVSDQLHAPAALPQEKNPWYPLDRRLGGPQSRSGHGDEEKNSQPPPGIEPKNPDLPGRSPALYRLSYHGSYCSTDVSKMCLSGKQRLLKYFSFFLTFANSRKKLALYIVLRICLKKFK
jgi:hypothetical protein